MYSAAPAHQAINRDYSTYHNKESKYIPEHVPKKIFMLLVHQEQC